MTMKGWRTPTGLWLRRLLVSDVNGPYGRAMQDKGLVQFTEARHVPHRPQDLRAWVRRQHADTTAHVRAICDGSRHVGNIKIGGIEWAHGVGDVGLIVWEPGRGYGRAAMGLIDADAVALGLRVLTLGCYGTHTAMIGLAQSCGFTVVGTRPRFYLDAEGHEVDGLLWQKRLVP